ncbi:MAG: hypothetical protein PPP55_11320 [Halorubrum sp.]
MPQTGPQRIVDVGLIRTVSYGLLVGGATYLVAATYGPTSVWSRLGVAASLAVVYVGVVAALGVVRRRPHP